MLYMHGCVGKVLRHGLGAVSCASGRIPEAVEDTCARGRRCKPTTSRTSPCYGIPPPGSRMPTHCYSKPLRTQKNPWKFKSSHKGNGPQRSAERDGGAAHGNTNYSSSKCTTSARTVVQSQWDSIICNPANSPPKF